MRLANGGSRGGGNGSSGANVSIMPSNTSSIVQVQDNDGNVIGTRRQNMSTTTLPKVKGMPASNNTFDYRHMLIKRESSKCLVFRCSVR